MEPVVGGREPVESDPMTAAEFRMVRAWLGVTGEWLAGRLGVALRTVRRWEHGYTPVPDGVRLELEALEQVAAEQVEKLIVALRDAPDVVLTIPRVDSDWPAGWWLMVAARVAQEVPGLCVRYQDA